MRRRGANSVRENNAVRERLKDKIGLQQLWTEADSISRLTPSGLIMQTVRMATESIKASPFTALMTLLTMVFSLFAFAAFLLIAENVNRALVGTQSEVSMSIFLRDAATEEDRRLLEEQLKTSTIVRAQNYIDKSQALENFRKTVGEDSPLLEGIEGSNPLPASYEVTFRSVDELESQIDALAAQMKQISGVEQVEYSRGVVSAIVATLRTVQFVGSCAIGVMLFLSGFIITVAIRLALYAHRDEIEIMYLVGATRTFIRAPYMVEGLVQGMAGALLSVALLYLAFSPLRRSVESGQVASLVFSQMQFLSISSAILIVALGVFVGIMGSYVAVRKVSTVTIGE